MNSKSRNFRLLTLEVSLFGVLSGIVGAFLSIYALRLGATSQDIGLLSAMPALVTLIFLVPAGRFLERYTNILRPTVAVGFLQRFQYVLVALVVVLPAAFRVPALIAVVALGAMAAATGTVAFTVMFGLVVPESDRPRLVSTRSLLSSLISAVTAVVAGKLLEIEFLPFPWNYSSLFLMGFVFSLFSLQAVRKITVPPLKRPSGSPAASMSFKQIIATVRRQRPFMRFTVGTFIANWGINLPLPLYALYYVRVLHMGESWIGLITTVGWVVPIFCYPIWARLAERFGNRAIAAIGCIGLALFPLSTALSPSQEYLLIPAVIGGILSPPWGLGVFNGLFEVIPHTQQPTYISVHTAVMNLAAFTAPLLATMVLVPLIGIGPSLLVGAAARAFGGIVLFIVVGR